MAKRLFLFLCVFSLNYQVQLQIVRSPMSLVNRPYTETILEAPRNYIETYIDAPRNYIETPHGYIEAPKNFIEAPRIYADAPESSRNFVNIPRIIEAPRNYLQQQPSIIAEPPCNGILPVANIPNPYPNIPNQPSTTIITDCTPSVCKNLVDTINIMTVCNLLQNSKGANQAALQFAGPVLKDLLSKPNLAGGLLNPKSDLKPNYVGPNVYAPNVLGPNVVAPNFLLQNLIGPSLAASSAYPPNSVGASGMNAAVPLSPNASVNSGALLSSLLKLLGGAA